MSERPEGWPFGDLPLFGFDLIMADPAWRFRTWSAKGLKKSPDAHYRTMTIEEIMALPVGHLLAPTGLVVLWCTWPLLLDSGDPGRRVLGDPSLSPVGRVLKAWGLRYVTGGAWHKTTVNGKTSFGPGHVLRTSCEPFLIAVNGSPKTSRSARNIIRSIEPLLDQQGNAFDGLRREHSRKPEAAYDWIEALMPDARRLDLFSRRSRPGWSAWGDEAGKFDPDSPAGNREGEAAPHPAVPAKAASKGRRAAA